MVEHLEDDRAAMEMTHPFDLSDSVQQYDRCAPLSRTTVKVNEQNTQKALSMTWFRRSTKICTESDRNVTN